MLKYLLCATLIIILTGTSLGQSLPDTLKTPGSFNNTVMLMELCHPEYLRGLNISPTTRANVLKKYGLTEANMNSYILDFLIPVNLGGNDSVSNIWPQPRTGTWTYWKKNELEKKLNYLVCNAQISLKHARYIIQSDWILAYRVFVIEDSTLHYDPYSEMP